MIHSNSEIGSGSPPHAAEVEPPAAVVHAGGSADAGEVAADVRAHLVFDRWDKHPDAPGYWFRLPSWVQEFATQCVVATERRFASPPTAVKHCGASPDHVDIMETIGNAADDWQKQGYTSALAEVRDMANVGRALMEALPEGYSYLNCPSEIVSDLQNGQEQAAPASDVAIWSGEHRAYWRRGSRGEGAHYTLNVDEAGIWSREDATRLTSHCGPDKLIALHDRPSQSKEHTP